MSQYYYTAASLPMLFYDEDAPVSRSSFLETCGIELAEEDYSIIQKTDLNDTESSEPTCAVLEEWRAWETGLRNRLVKTRAHRKGWDTEKYLKEGPDIFGVREVARQATSEGTPLHGEDLLDRSRWSFLDQLEASHFFDIEKLVVYYLKLQIAERKTLFDREKGTQVFDATVEGISGR